MKKKYAVVDLETTGGMFKRDRITEVGIVIFDGEKVIETYQSFVNPERSIPPQITRLTGITNYMVMYAPKFYEIAKEIVLKTEGCIFVAHNVRFDYMFLRAEFERLGFTYTRRQLCTCRLSRTTFTDFESHSLGNLIKQFGIQVEHRHRALDDAKAATVVLQKCLEVNDGADIKTMVNQGIQESKLPPNISIDELHELPETCGVYYLYDVHLEIIYIGKAKNLKKRIFQHFEGMTNKSSKLAREVNSITFEETGSELISLVFEAHEIKLHYPRINKQLRRKSFQYAVYSEMGLDGYIRFTAVKRLKKPGNKLEVNQYPSLNSAKSALSGMAMELELCKKLRGLDQAVQACFGYKIGQCHGACIGEESPEEYNLRAQLATRLMEKPLKGTFGVVDQGRNESEWSVLLVIDGIYKGFGYVDQQSFDGSLNDFESNIEPYHSDKDIEQIISQQLYKQNIQQVITFDKTKIEL